MKTSYLFSFLLCFASLQAADDDLIITPKVIAPNKTADLCKTFASKDSQTNKDKVLTDYLLYSDKDKTLNNLLPFVDYCKTSEANIRIGALKVIEALKSKQPIISFYLAICSANDPEKEVRKTAIEVIKTRKDDAAIGNMIREFLSAYNETGELKDAALRDKSVEAFKDLNDKRVLKQLLYYVTMEIRVTKCDLNNLSTNYINSFTAVGGGTNSPLLVPLSLPIQFPNVSIMSVQTTVKCPASSALEDLSGQNFGIDVGKWNNWLAKQK